jgi:hypothetical protein
MAARLVTNDTGVVLGEPFEGIDVVRLQPYNGHGRNERSDPERDRLIDEIYIATDLRDHDLFVPVVTARF